jgi:hypothetical protein
VNGVPKGDALEASGVLQNSSSTIRVAMRALMTRITSAARPVCAYDDASADSPNGEEPVLPASGLHF